jgi:oxygen-independent coproporphyrinogen-3 oxidase
VIKRLICDFRLSFAVVEQMFGLNFKEYFAEDLKLLQTFIDDGLVRMTNAGLEVSSTGQLLIRNICMCFDVYLRNKARQQQFSRVI